MFTHRIVTAISALVILAVILTGPAVAQTSQSGDISSSDLTGYLNDFMTDEMEELDIPGAALVIVSQGEVVFLEGYGSADRETGQLVDPVDTVFVLGSVTKPITSLAVHQQIEAGRLDLDDAASEYVEFDLPLYADTAISLGSLLTHTSGLENPNMGTITSSADDIEPLGTYLPRSVPGRFAPTGEVHSYTNWGYALAGHLVEQTSGEDLPNYVATQVFQPLGMSSSAWIHTMSSEIEDRVATGYTGGTGARVADSTSKYEREYPAGGVVTTASDMAPFMIALLNGAPGVISQETAAQYLTTTHRPAPTMPGRTQGGLEERFTNGHRLLVHGGDTFSFSSQMGLIPDEDFGFFLIYNTFNDEFRENVTTALMDRLFTGENEAAPSIDLTSDELATYAGSYRWTRYVRGNVEKAVALTPPYNTIVSADREGTLTVSFIGLDGSWTYEPIGDHAFSKVAGERALVDGLVVDPGDRISFTMTDGKVQYLNISLHTIAAEPVPFVLMGVPQISMFATIVIIFAVSLIIWSLGWIVRAIRKKPHVSGRARLALSLAVLIGILIIAGFAAFIGGISSDIVYGAPPILFVATTLLSVAAIAGLALIPAAVLAWRSKWFTVGGRILYTLLAVTTPLTLSWVWYWNLLGYQW